jgi:hypothetical protein
MLLTIFSDKNLLYIVLLLSITEGALSTCSNFDSDYFISKIFSSLIAVYTFY